MTDAPSPGDLHAIVSKVVARYCRALDGKDPEGLISVFTADATVVTASGMTATGRAAISELYAPVFASSKTSKHFITNLDVEEGEDGRVRSTSYLFATRCRESSLWITWGSYRHRFELVGRTWLIAEKVITVDVPELRVGVTITDDRWRTPEQGAPSDT